MKCKIICKKCEGTGRLFVAPALANIMGVMPAQGHAWLGLREIRARLKAIGVVMTSAALSARLKKLEEHGLLQRGPSDEDKYILWSRK